MRERKIAGAPISWGVSEVPNWGAQLSPDRVLDEAQRLGFRATEAGPPGFLPSDAAAAARTLDAHGLRCIGGFVTAVVHDRARRDAELASVERQAAWLHAAGAELLVLAAATGRDGYEERRELSDAEWTTLFETLPLIEAIATAARLTVAVHPHVGTVIEQPRDVERLLARSHVSLCLDTGHVFVGGGDPAGVARAAGRRVRHVRATAETRIAVRLGLDGASRVSVDTGAGIYDHFLEQLAFHGGLDLVVDGSGDWETGDHHTAEDTAIAFGEALDQALGDRRGIARYGSAVVPMDDALARAAVDLGGRRGAEISLEEDPGLARHTLESLAQAARMTLHVTATGRDPHHVAEAACKAVGRALREAVRREGSELPSTKGLL